MKVNSYTDNLLQEREDLGEKLDHLFNYMTHPTSTFRDLPFVNKRLIRAQYVVMQKYWSIVDQRVGLVDKFVSRAVKEAEDLISEKSVLDTKENENGKI